VNKYALGTIVGTALLSFAKAKKGAKNKYIPDNIEDIYNLSPQEKAQITDLELVSMSLTYLPDDILDGFTNLKTLNVLNNQLTELPDSIGNLTNLEKLWLINNQLTELPESIVNLNNLKTLNLMNNQLTELPESIVNLTNLEQLYLKNNELTELPQWIGNLTNLEELSLRYNLLTELPDSIGNLINLGMLWLEENPWKKPVPKETILKMIRNRVKKGVIEAIVKMNNSIPTKSNLRIR